MSRVIPPRSSPPGQRHGSQHNFLCHELLCSLQWSLKLESRQHTVAAPSAALLFWIFLFSSLLGVRRSAFSRPRRRSQFTMDRPGRFSHHDSKFYEASYRSNTPGDRSKTPASTGEEIKLDELYEWTRRKEWPARNDAEDLRQWRKRATATADDIKDWPNVVIEKEASDSPRGAPDRQHYDRNFLHPPTPSPQGFPPTTSQADDYVPSALPRRPTSLSMNMDKTSRFGWWTLVLLLITAIMTILTAVYANGSVKSLMQDKFFTTSSANAILILRILTEACALLFAALVMVVVEDLQWALASRPTGVSLLHFVGLDAGTGVWGLLRLLATADWGHKYSSLFRLVVICIIPLPGIVLMGDITLELVFFPRDTYNVSAGIDQFNASYIAEVDETIVTAMLIQMGSMTWSTKDTWTLDPLGPKYGKCTVSKTDSSWIPCDESHLLVGGVLGISPQSDDLTTFTDSTAYVVPKTRSLHLEYGTVHDIEGLYKNGTCYTIGADTAAAYWCADTGTDKELLFGKDVDENPILVPPSPPPPPQKKLKCGLSNTVLFFIQALPTVHWQSSPRLPA